MVQRRQHRVCLITTNQRAIVLPERNDKVVARTRLGNSEMNSIFEELALKGWVLEPTTGTRLKAYGPADEGPVYLSMRATGREVQNQRRNLRQAGFVFDGDPVHDEQEEEVAATISDKPGLILPVTQDDIPISLWQLLTSFAGTLRDEFAAAKASGDGAEWQVLYEEEVNKNSYLEEANKELEKRAEKAEKRWNQLQMLLKD